MQTQPKIGRDFHLHEVVDAETKYLREATKTKIALTLLVTFLISLICAFILSLLTWDFTILRSFWMVVAAPFGGVIVHYFGKTSVNDKVNNEGST